MKYYRYSMKVHYIIQPKLTGEKIINIEDKSFELLKNVLKCLEDVKVYIPEDQNEFKNLIINKLRELGISVSLGINTAATQYFVNCQIERFLKSKLLGSNWNITREQNYSNESGHTVDVRIESTEYNSNVWIESDNAREDQLYKKLWEKLPIILKHGNIDCDIYIPLIYTTKPTNEIKKVSRIAKGLRDTINTNIDVHKIKTSFAIFYIDKDSQKICSNIELEITNDNLPFIKVREITK